MCALKLPSAHSPQDGPSVVPNAGAVLFWARVSSEVFPDTAPKLQLAVVNIASVTLSLPSRGCRRRRSPEQLPNCKFDKLGRARLLRGLHGFACLQWFLPKGGAVPWVCPLRLPLLDLPYRRRATIFNALRARPFRAERTCCQLQVNNR